MLNLNGLFKMVAFKGKEQRDQDVAKVQAMPRFETTVYELSCNPDRAEWTNCSFYIISASNELVKVDHALYTGNVLPNGIAQWKVFSNSGGILVDKGFVFDDTTVYITRPEYRPLQKVWELYVEHYKEN